MSKPIPPVVEEIKRLPEYKALLELGLTDTSSNLIHANCNFRFEGVILTNKPISSWYVPVETDASTSYTIYQNGYVRTNRGGIPSPIPSLRTSDVATVADWRVKLDQTRQYILRNELLKGRFGINARREQEKLTQGTNADFVNACIASGIPGFVEEIESVAPDLIKYISPESLADKIKQNPGSATELLKRIGKVDIVKKAIELLPDSIRSGFEDQLDLKSDLNDIGF